MGDTAASNGHLAASVTRCDFAFTTPDLRAKQVLFAVDLHVRHGERVLLIGPNGAGKSTLLRLLAGKNLPQDRESVMVLGQPAFFQTLGLSGVSFLGNALWQRPVAFVASAVTYEADIRAGDMLAELQDEFRERRDELVRILDIDLDWKLNAVSDGQRRRVQIMLGLLRPFKLLLVDEMTVDLDVLARQDLLQYLRRETEQRLCTIVYCTHIFDGLDEWPTSVVFMANGRVVDTVVAPLQERLFTLAMRFMRRMREEDDKNEDGRQARRQQQRDEADAGFGGPGYGAGRLFPSTDILSRSRMDAYR